jgi:hypothetical protein
MRQPYPSLPIVGNCSIDLLLAETPVVMNEDFKNENLLWSWRERHNLYCSPHIVKVMKSKRVRWAEYVAHAWER